MPTSVTLGPPGAAPIMPIGVEVSRAIDAQQRQLAAGVGGDALGVAEARQRDDVAAVDQIAGRSGHGRWRDEHAGAVFDLAARRVGAPATAKPVANGTKALDIGATSGSMVPSIAWS